MATGKDYEQHEPDEPATPPLRPARQRLEDIIGGMSPRRRAFNEKFSAGLDTSLSFLRDHWLAIFNGALGVFVGLAVLAPIGYAVGLTGPASAVFDAYRFACAQTPSHSLFIFGYQICLCSRCLAIYSTMLTAGVALALVRHHRVIRSIPWYVWLLAMVPMAIDGFTQLFGLRESNLALRLLTGFLFGLGTSWFLLPQIENAATDDAPARPAYYAAPQDMASWMNGPGI